jgi:hypothetical protein
MMSAIFLALSPAALLAQQLIEVKNAQAAQDQAKQVEDAQLKRYIQLLQPVMWRELEFVRLTCNLTPEQRPTIKAAAKDAVKEAARLFAPQRNQRPVQPVNPTVAGLSVRRAVHTAVCENVTAEQFAAYSAEAEKRQAAIKQATILNTVAHLDSALYLKQDQRAAIAAALEKEWKEEWEHWLVMRRYGDQYFPQVPNPCVVPHLTAEQNSVWDTLQKTTIYGWMSDNQAHDEAWWTEQDKHANGSCGGDDDQIVNGPAENATPEEQSIQNFKANFDQWLFGNLNEGGIEAGRQRLENQIQLQLAEASRVCQLTEDQRAKLGLAARGDVQRFLDESNGLWRKVLAGKLDQEALNNLGQLVQPLARRRMRGLTGPGSLYVKAVAGLLTSEQRAAYDALITERRRYRYQAAIGSAIYCLEPTVALTQAQREALTQFLLELPPPCVFGENDINFILYQLATAPHDKLKPQFAERQWQGLEQYVNRYRGLREHLIQCGCLDRDDNANEKLAEDRP